MESLSESLKFRRSSYNSSKFQSCYLFTFILNCFLCTLYSSFFFFLCSASFLCCLFCLSFYLSSYLSSSFFFSLFWKDSAADSKAPYDSSSSEELSKISKFATLDGLCLLFFLSPFMNSRSSFMKICSQFDRSGNKFPSPLVKEPLELLWPRFIAGTYISDRQSSTSSSSQSQSRPKSILVYLGQCWMRVVFCFL